MRLAPDMARPRPEPVSGGVGAMSARSWTTTCAMAVVEHHKLQGNSRTKGAWNHPLVSIETTTSRRRCTTAKRNAHADRSLRYRDVRLSVNACAFSLRTVKGGGRVPREPSTDCDRGEGPWSCLKRREPLANFANCASRIACRQAGLALLKCLIALPDGRGSQDLRAVKSGTASVSESPPPDPS